jgi:hypothetical protein
LGIRRHRYSTHDPRSGQRRDAIIASAVLVSQSQVRRVVRQQDWQTRAWGYYDSVGELRFATTWLANALSRSRLFVGTPDPNGEGDPTPVEDEQVRVPLEEWGGGMTAQAEMLRRLATHLTVPGESYLVGYDDPDTGQRAWVVASQNELQAKAGGQLAVVVADRDQPLRLDPAKSTIVRIWRPHANDVRGADSPCRPLLGTLAELAALSGHILATVDSRLAGAGILAVPESASTPAPQESEGTANPLHEDPFMASLIDAMVTPITDRDNASAVVPILIRVPDAAIGKIQHLSLATPFDAQIEPLRASAIRRLALGVDIPPEVLLGVGQSSNHWNAWAIDESAIKLHVEPLLGVICAALTERFLRPALTALRVPNPTDYVVWFDTSQLAQRPNQGPEAITLYQQGLLSEDAARRENGFGDQDAPTPAEWRRWLLVQLLQRAPQLAPELLRALDIPVALPLPAAPTAPAGGPDGGADGGAGGQPQVEPGSRDEPPAGPNPESAAPPPPSGGRGGAAASLIAAAEAGTLRALEVAGKRLLDRRARHQHPDVPAWELHTVISTHGRDLDRLLDGAYTVLEAALPDQPCVHRAVHEYVLDLLRAGEPHQRGYLAAYLEREGCAHAA